RHHRSPANCIDTREPSELLVPLPGRQDRREISSPATVDPWKSALSANPSQCRPLNRTKGAGDRELATLGIGLPRSLELRQRDERTGVPHDAELVDAGWRRRLRPADATPRQLERLQEKARQKPGGLYMKGSV